jgi:hypothetical protein
MRDTISGGWRENVEKENNVAIFYAMPCCCVGRRCGRFFDANKFI